MKLRNKPEHRGAILKEREATGGREASAMKGIIRKTRKPAIRETLTEAYEVRAFRDESEEIR